VHRRFGLSDSSRCTPALLTFFQPSCAPPVKKSSRTPGANDGVANWHGSVRSRDGSCPKEGRAIFVQRWPTCGVSMLLGIPRSGDAVDVWFCSAGSHRGSWPCATVYARYPERVVYPRVAGELMGVRSREKHRIAKQLKNRARVSNEHS
jgi:hypothetical protein